MTSPYPFDLVALRQKYDARADELLRTHEQTTARLRKQLEEPKDSLWFGLFFGTPLALLAAVMLPISAKLSVLLFIFALPFLVYAAFSDTRTKTRARALAIRQRTADEHLAFCLELNQETQARLLENRGGLLGWYRKEWRSFAAGTGGFDLYIEEYCATLPAEDAHVFLVQLATNLQTYIDFFRERGEQDAQGRAVSRYSAWTERRRIDREAGRPVSLAEAREHQAAQAADVWASYKDQDPEVADFLASWQADQVPSHE